MSRSTASRPQLVGPASELEVATFLAHCRPSASRRSKGDWYWCRAASEAREKEQDVDGFRHEAEPLLRDLERDVEQIELRAPVHGRPSLGILSRSQRLEQARTAFNAKIKRLAHEHGVLTGKWTFYRSDKEIDKLWTKVVRSVMSGALAQTGVRTAKVSAYLHKNYRSYCICIYTPDCYDRNSVERVLRAILEDIRNRPDVYTHLDITKGHKSGIRSSLYRPADFPSVEVQALMSKSSKAKTVKPKTLSEEIEAGGADGFDEVLSSDEED